MSVRILVLGVAAAASVALASSSPARATRADVLSCPAKCTSCTCTVREGSSVCFCIRPADDKPSSIKRPWMLGRPPTAAISRPPTVAR